MAHVEIDYRYRAAGRWWVIPKLTLVRLPDGSNALTQVEIDRVHLAIANRICGSSEGLRRDEFEFLCAVAEVSQAATAEYLAIDRSTLTKWKGSDKPMPLARSAVLRRWFWMILFGEDSARVHVPLTALRSEKEILGWLEEAALAMNLVDAVRSEDERAGTLQRRVEAHRERAELMVRQLSGQRGF